MGGGEAKFVGESTGGGFLDYGESGRNLVDVELG